MKVRTSSFSRFPVFRVCILPALVTWGLGLEACLAQEPFRQPFLQFGVAPAYSGIDFSRYEGSTNYRGLNARAVVQAGKKTSWLFISAEYSSFPRHELFPAWTEIRSVKKDLNMQVSFFTNYIGTTIFIISGINRHDWKAQRTTLSDNHPLSQGVPAGEILHLVKYGFNAGCGFRQHLYENLSLFGDYKFCISRANNIEKLRIFDVTAALGLSYGFTLPEEKEKKNKKTGKGFLGKKIYKWTEKGGK